MDHKTKQKNKWLNGTIYKVLVVTLMPLQQWPSYPHLLEWDQDKHDQQHPTCRKSKGINHSPSSCPLMHVFMINFSFWTSVKYQPLQTSSLHQYSISTKDGFTICCEPTIKGFNHWPCASKFNLKCRKITHSTDTSEDLLRLWLRHH